MEILHITSDGPDYTAPTVAFLDQTVKGYMDHHRNLRPALPQQMPVYEAVKVLWEMKRLMGFVSPELATTTIHVRKVALDYINKWRNIKGLSLQMFDTAEVGSPARTLHRTLHSMFLGTNGHITSTAVLVNYEVTDDRIYFQYADGSRVYLEWDNMHSHSVWLKALLALVPTLDLSVPFHNESFRVNKQ